jgi:type IV fimbrial biogenesis protein FimU
MQRSIRGFTMVELMVALAVFAILAALAMPAFDGAFERSRADTEIESVVRVFNLARLEAINRGQNVRVQPSDDGEWASALTVMLDADETVLRNVPALAAGAALEEEGDAGSIVFNGLGALQSPNAAVAFTYTRGDATRVVAVCVVGRVQTGEACQ